MANLTKRIFLGRECGSWASLAVLLEMAFVVMELGAGSGRTSAAPVEQGVRGLDASQQYAWWPQRATSGALTLYIDTSVQEATVYRNGTMVGWAIASTGRRGRETPTGTYTILDKREAHRSARYQDAPMPYMQRLTDDGIAIQGGLVPNYPASRGCIRLPLEFARLLYAATDADTRVIVF